MKKTYASMQGPFSTLSRGSVHRPATSFGDRSLFKSGVTGSEQPKTLKKVISYREISPDRTRQDTKPTESDVVLMAPTSEYNSNQTSEAFTCPI